MAEEEVDFSKLSLEERCTHKNWKARVSAYDELSKTFQKIYEEKHADWPKYGNWVRKFPTDSNAAAQEKALEVTLLFMQRAGCAGRVVSEVMSGVVNKCITAPKAKSKELAAEIALTCVEIEKQEQTQEELSKGMEQKNPKVVAGCIVILTQIMREFGAKVINLKPLVKKIPTLCEDRDKTVREETKKLIIELYRWIGAGLKPQLSALKPVMMQELETEFEKIANEKPHAKRLLRSQQAKMEQAAYGEAEDAEGEDAVDAEEAAPEIDPYDLMDPVDILSKIPKDFYEKCEAKKWQDRKEAMEALDALASSPKLEAGDYSDVVRTLKRIIGKDTNILVVALAGKCVAGLANGLKKKFAPYAASCISTILEKFKEKKANVVAAMRSAIDASFEASSLEAIQEDAIGALQNKNPAVKTETCLFLGRAFAKSPYKSMSDKKLMKGYLTAVLANLNESDPGVRDAAAEAMGVALKYLGEKNMAPFTADLDPIKLQKVKEIAEKAVITAPKAPAEKKPKPASAARSETNVGGGAKKTGATIKKPSTAPVGEKRTGTGVRGGGGKGQASSPSKEDDIMEVASGDTIADPSARVDISGLLTESLMNEMNDKNWKVREEAMDKVRGILSTKKNIMPTLGDLPKNLAQRLLDSNKNLAVCAFLVCQNLAPALGPYCKNHINTVLPNMLAGLSDSKPTVRAQVSACIDAWADNAGVQEIFQCEFIADALKTGNHFTRSEIYNWLAARLPTMRSVSKDELLACLPYVYATIEDRNADVRRAAQEVMMPMMMHLGYELMLRNTSKLKPGTEKVVKAALEKARNDLPLTAPSTNKPSSGAGVKGSKSTSASSLPRANKSGSDTNLNADASAQKGKPGRATMSKPGTKTSPSSKKSVEDPIGTNLPLNSPKQQRILDETRLKILRWTFTTPREEFIDLLKELMTTAGIGKTLMTNMFSSDFKMHIRALDTLLEELNFGIDGTISNLDLILKWLTLRFFDTNPTVLIRSLDYLGHVFRILGEVGYQMPDVEANAFLPNLLMKIGDPKDNVKTSVHSILRQVSMVHSPQRVFSFIMEGIKSKNARQRAECLDELANMIATLGITVIQPTPAAGLREIAKQISDRDNGVRNAALNAVVQVYHYEGDKTYKMIGQLADKDQSLLDERIKRAGKQRPPMLQQIPQPPLGQQHRSNQSSFGSNGSSPNATTLSPQGNSKLIPPNALNNAILQPQNLNSTMVTAINNEEDDEMMMPPPPGRQGFAPPPAQEAPKAHIVPEKYRLDFETIENMFRDEPPLTQLKLLDTNIDGFMKQKPPSLPTRKLVAPVAATLTKDKSAKQTPSRATQSIDLIISNVGQNDLRASMEALTQLDSMISDVSIVQIMSNRVDHMLSMASLQIHRLQGTIETANPDRLTDVNKFYRCAVAFLTSLYKGEFLPQKASKETIKDLIQNLLLLIIDPSLERLSDAAPIVRLINIMVVRIIEKSDPNAVTCALIRLLNETLTSSKQPRMLDLVMKCQWKLLKQFSVWEQWNYDWDVSAIITEFHLFMRSHPFNSFQGQDITPLKTMKTILHALVVHLGGEVIAQHLSFMPEVQESEAGLYINKVIQREMGKKRHGGQGNVVGGTPSRNNHATGGRTDSSASNNVSGRPVMADNYNQVSNPNNNVNDFMNSLPDPSDAPTDEAKEQAYMQRVRMILMRGGLNVPRGPSVTLSKNLNDGGEESSI